MKQLVIGCSSFANPKHKAWKKVKNRYDLTFMDYGDIGGIANPDFYRKSLTYILFLEDSLQGNLNANSEENTNTFFQHVLSLIEARCENSAEPFIFCFSSWNSNNVIRNAKTIDGRYKLHRQFLAQLEKIASDRPTFCFVDLDQCFSVLGLSNCFDKRNWYFAHTRLSSLGYEEMVDSLDMVLTRFECAAHKVLVLDCDNTLWGGVVGEDGLSGLELGTDGLGQAFVDFQREILKLKEDGVLLVLASKNNEKDVWEVFDNHENMILSRSDIVAHKINWEDKSKNIYDLSVELGLGVDSFVFWDDNPIEREKAKTMINAMHTVEVPKNVWEWPSLVGNLKEFSKFFITEEDKKKTVQYEARSKFLELKKEKLDEQSFLRKIKLKAELIPFGQTTSRRAEQLCKKTNQFNLTTKRHSEESLKSLVLENSYYCSLTSLKDIFGDHGVVGLFCLKPLNDEDLYIDSFLLSCRVLGRQFELWMMSQIIQIARSEGFTRLIAEYVPSERNDVAKGFLQSCGFTQLSGELQSNCKKNSTIDFEGILYSMKPTKVEKFDEDLYEH